MQSPASAGSAPPAAVMLYVSQINSFNVARMAKTHRTFIEGDLFIKREMEISLVELFKFKEWT